MKKLIKKIRFRRCVSMKVPLLFCFLLVTLVPLLVQARFLAGFFRQSQIEDSMIEAQSKLDVYKRQEYAYGCRC